MRNSHRRLRAFRRHLPLSVLRPPPGPGPVLPAVLAGGCALALAALACAVRRRPENPVDTAARDAALSSAPAPLREAHRPLRPVGKWWTQVPLALAAAALLAPTRGAAAAVPVALSGLLSAGLAEGWEAWLPSRPPPPGRGDPEEPSFPSGHSTLPTAVALTTAWVLSREGLVPLKASAPVALAVPLVMGAAQLPGERHWLTDVLGGWLAATSIASGCAALYHVLRER